MSQRFRTLTPTKSRLQHRWALSKDNDLRNYPLTGWRMVSGEDSDESSSGRPVRGVDSERQGLAKLLKPPTALRIVR